MLARLSQAWWSCECYNIFYLFFCLQLLSWLEEHGCHVTCALIGMSCKLAAYSYKGSLWMRLEYEPVDTSRVCPACPQGQSRICYQECVTSSQTLFTQHTFLYTCTRIVISSTISSSVWLPCSLHAESNRSHVQQMCSVCHRMND